MTTTTLNNAQSIGTSTNVGPGLYPVKTTLQAGTTAFSITAVLTFTTQNREAVSTPVRVWYTSSPQDITAAQAVAQLAQGARFVDVKGNPEPSRSGLISTRNSFIEPVQGAYVYTWLELPAFAAAATLTTKLVEI